MNNTNQRTREKRKTTRQKLQYSFDVKPRRFKPQINCLHVPKAFHRVAQQEITNVDVRLNYAIYNIVAIYNVFIMYSQQAIHFCWKIVSSAPPSDNVQLHMLPSTHRSQENDDRQCKPPIRAIYLTPHKTNGNLHFCILQLIPSRSDMLN